MEVRSIRPPRHAAPEDDDQEAQRVIQTGVTTHLNFEGGHRGGHVCPREWYIYQTQPPHVSAAAWAGMSPEVRRQHIGWLLDIRAMPADLLSMPLHSAILEFVRRLACARHWKWSTITRHLSTIQAALLQLPLYTNQKTPIDLRLFPEWLQALTGTRRFERQSIPQPPAPLTRSEYDVAYRLLRENPTAQVFLAIMWACAARPGDIDQLRARDVHIGESLSPGTVRFQLTIRRGKGARFRGPYVIPSVLSRQDASLLQGLLSRLATPDSRLFTDPTGVRIAVRRAIQSANSAAALPSLRKGAARALADGGMSEEALMRITGHTRVDTLRRYLGYGLHTTAEDVAVQDSVNRVLHQQAR
eukprot:gene12665-biopygen9305